MKNLFSTAALFAALLCCSAGTAFAQSDAPGNSTEIIADIDASKAEIRSALNEIEAEIAKGGADTEGLSVAADALRGALNDLEAAEAKGQEAVVIKSGTPGDERIEITTEGEEGGKKVEVLVLREEEVVRNGEVPEKKEVEIKVKKKRR